MLRFLFSVIPSEAEGSPRSDFLSVIPSQAELMDPAQPRISQVNIRAFRIEHGSSVYVGEYRGDDSAWLAARLNEGRTLR